MLTIATGSRGRSWSGLIAERAEVNPARATVTPPADNGGVTSTDQPPTGDEGASTTLDRYEAQHDVMMAELREAVSSNEERVRVLAERAIGLGSQIVGLQGRLAATLAELDAAGGCAGHRSAGSWAGWHLGLPAGEACRLSKVAGALADRPVLAAACEEGSIPLSAAAMVADITTPDNEAEAVELARNVTGSQVAKICSDYRHATRHDTADPPDPALSFTKHRGGYQVGGWLPALGGDRVKQGLQAELDRLRDDHVTEGDGPHAKPTRVDVFLSLAERALDPDVVTVERAEKYLTMIHVGLDDRITLTDDTPVDIDDFKTTWGISGSRGWCRCADPCCGPPTRSAPPRGLTAVAALRAP